MSISHLETQPGLWRPPEEPSFTPLDAKILCGVELTRHDDEIRGLNTAKTLMRILFELHHADATREAGDCIAYSTSLSDEDIAKVEETLVSSSPQAPQGTLNLIPAESSNDIAGFWKASTRIREFTFQRITGTIALSDGTHPEGAIFNLLSVPKRSKA